MEINNLGYTDDRARYKPVLVAFLKGVEHRLCANCQRRIEANPLRVLDCKVPDCRAATENAPRLADSLSKRRAITMNGSQPACRLSAFLFT